MEREERRDDRQRFRPEGGGGDPDDDDLDEVRERLEGMLDDVDRTLDAVVPSNAEKYLHQQRQRGAE